SLKPGSTSFPPASITLVEAPRQPWTSAWDPTATILSPMIATACALGSLLSTVQTFALVTIRSAVGFDCAHTPMADRSNPNHAIARENLISFLKHPFPGQRMNRKRLDLSPLQFRAEYFEEVPFHLKKLYLVLRFATNHSIPIQRRSSELSIDTQESLLVARLHHNHNLRGILHH